MKDPFFTPSLLAINHYAFCNPYIDYNGYTSFRQSISSYPHSFDFFIGLLSSKNHLNDHVLLNQLLPPVLKDEDQVGNRILVCILDQLVGRVKGIHPITVLQGIVRPGTAACQNTDQKKEGKNPVFDPKAMGIENASYWEETATEK